MNSTSHLRLAMLFPTVELGTYWKPVLYELTKLSQKTILYTGCPWKGFDPQSVDVPVEVVGETKRITSSEEKNDYSGGYMVLSPSIVRRLLQLKPHVIFSCGFSTWTLLALLLKPIGRWRVVIAWDGSSPNVDFRQSKPRLLIRRLMARLADSYITNSYGGKNYFVDCLGISSDRILVRPYLVPDPSALLHDTEGFDASLLAHQHPIFLYVGRLESRKGVHHLIEACISLKQQGYQNYTVLLVGDGPQRKALQELCQQHSLEDCIKWLGWIRYDRLGFYLQASDVFIFPTLEDIWGMVVLEAMSFSLPILCSKWAGASEMVVAEENGYIFDPHVPEELAKYMQFFIDDSGLAYQMGKKSYQLIMPHTPKAAAQFFIKVAQNISIEAY
jgi:glycosyltransferase involved in cell wall biosynthesis